MVRFKVRYFSFRVMIVADLAAQKVEQMAPSRASVSRTIRLERHQRQCSNQLIASS